MIFDEIQHGDQESEYNDSDSNDSYSDDSDSNDSDSDDSDSDASDINEELKYLINKLRRFFFFLTFCKNNLKKKLSA